jgi:hypothetical protein
MKTIPLLFALFLSLQLFGQGGVPPASGARGIAMGNTGVTFQDIHSAFGNQAGLAWLQGFSATVQGEQRFLIGEIRSVAAAAALPTSSGTFGLNIQYFGFEAFNEQRIGLAYGRQLLENFSIGAQVDLLNTRIQEYGSNMAVTFELGAQARISKQLIFGIHAYSPAEIKILEDEALPTVFSSGIAYLPSEKVFVTLELEKDIQFPLRVKGGFEYQVIDILLSESRFSNQPGAGFLRTRLAIRQRNSNRFS